MPRGRPRNKRSRKLTVREKKLFLGLKEGKTKKQAALDAGYSSQSPSTSATRAMKQIEQKVPSLFERHGLDDDSFVKKCILPAANATERKVHFHEGKFHYSAPLIAWTPRTTTNRLIAEMKGMVKQEAENTMTGVTVIINAANRPPRPAPEELPPANSNGDKASGNGA